MGRASELQENFRRNGREVDRERVAALAAEMIDQRGKKLMDDQVPVFEGCEELLGDGGEEGWKALESSCPDVEMSMKYFPPKKGERSIATGKVVGIVDISAEEVAAWVMDYCNNERMRMIKEEGHPARLELREKARVNERTFATVKNMPFFLDNREFVARQVWKSEEGKVLLAFGPVDDEIDYGVKLKKIRGPTRGMWQIYNLPVRGGAKQCRVTLVQQLDAGGSIPTWVMDKKISLSLKCVQEVIDEFRQDDKVDAADASLKRLSNKFEVSLKEGNWKTVKSPDPFVTMEFMGLGSDGGSTVGIGRAVTVVDATMEDCAAWEWAKMTRQRVRVHYEFGGLERKAVKINEHSEMFYLAVGFGVTGLSPREYLTKNVWKVVNENIMVVGYDVVEHDDVPNGGGKKYVRASTSGFFRYEKLPEVKGVPQTRVTYLTQMDLKGLIPKWVMNSKAVGILRLLSTMRKKFDREHDIDVGQRAELVRAIKREEKVEGAEALEQFEALYEEKEGSNVAVSAEVEEVAAFFWDFGSRTNMEISGDVERTFEEDEEEAGGLKKIVKRRHKLESAHGTHHRDRLFVSEMTLTRDLEGNIIILVLTLEDEGRKGGKSVKARGSVVLSDDSSTWAIDGKEKVAITLQRISEGKTKLEFACSFEVGFTTSRRASLAFAERRLEEIADVSVYFQRRVPLAKYGVKDGVALGHDMLWKTASSGKKRVQCLEEVLTKSQALKELNLRHTWIKAMMATALEGRVAMNRPVGTKLVCVSDAEATQIGRNLIPSLMTEQLAQAGVNQWRVQNKAMKELMKEEIWFESTCVVLGKGIVKSAAWGLMARVIIGAVVSLTDLVTDVIMLREYWIGGEALSGYRNASLASLVASMFLQLLLVAFQNRKKGLLRIAKEAFIVLIGMKAPWDAFRVASGAEQEMATELDPMTEMTVGKGIELVAESIPSVIIQTSAILYSMNNGKDVSPTAIFSLLTSALTIGFISATLSYDYDTDPKKRAYNPDFYGYVPDSSSRRALLFLTMMLMPGVQVLIKGTLVIVLGLARYAREYNRGDMLLFLTYKIIRRDFQYWIPLYGVAGFAVSLLVRVAVKAIADFTGCLHFRHPYEVGGIYFTINLFLPTIGLVAVMLSMDLSAHNFSDTTITFLETVVPVLVSSLVFLFGLFFVIINKEYWRTFFSFETGAQMTRRNFLDGDNVMKCEVFGCHASQWYPIKGKVEQWVSSGWAQWEEERPEWFSDIWKESVLEEMRPLKRRSSSLSKRSLKEKLGEEHKESLRQGDAGAGSRGGGGGGGDGAKVYPAGGERGEGNEEIDIEEFQRELMKMNF
ncbi:hypothetical protein TL16_g13066 [Triparma laevis f. inornata]|uniref:START domain-containing protein n=1 Tax=Triparma laevis f. inornata TaxID=1714386 RepID=A0A9W7BZ47_9STRA|nr:hypothetical protein TL16_g13066 [Triparma laevis f. inornata]